MTDAFETEMDHPTGEICSACRKRSDATRPHRGVRVTYTLCGTHSDELSRELALRAFTVRERWEMTDAFVKRLREGRYAACWAVEQP